MKYKIIGKRFYSNGYKLLLTRTLITFPIMLCMKSHLNTLKGYNIARVLEFSSFMELYTIFYSPGNCVKCIVIDSSLLKSEFDSKFCFCSNGVLRYLFVAWSGGQGIIILINHWARWTLPLCKYSFPFFLFFPFILFQLLSF